MLTNMLIKKWIQQSEKTKSRNLEVAKVTSQTSRVCESSLQHHLDPSSWSKSSSCDMLMVPLVPLNQSHVWSKQKSHLNISQPKSISRFTKIPLQQSFSFFASQRWTLLSRRFVLCTVEADSDLLPMVLAGVAWDGRRKHQQLVWLLRKDSECCCQGSIPKAFHLNSPMTLNFDKKFGNKRVHGVCNKWIQMVQHDSTEPLGTSSFQCSAIYSIPPGKLSYWKSSCSIGQPLN